MLYRRSERWFADLLAFSPIEQPSDDIEYPIQRPPHPTSRKEQDQHAINHLLSSNLLELQRLEPMQLQLSVLLIVD